MNLKKIRQFDNIRKLELICEDCGFQTSKILIHKNMFYCKECLEAEERRDRFLKEDGKWNKIK